VAVDERIAGAAARGERSRVLKHWLAKVRFFGPSLQRALDIWASTRRRGPDPASPFSLNLAVSEGVS